MTATNIPGTGLSYAELLRNEESEIRTAWQQISALTETLGMSTMRLSGAIPRSASIEEMLEALTEVLPSQVSIKDLMKVTAEMFGRTYEKKYEVRTLTPGNASGVLPKWEVASVFDREDRALAARDEWMEKNGGHAVVVQIATEVTTDLVDRLSR